MMTSSDGSIFRVTGPLWWDFTPHKGQSRGAFMFFLSAQSRRRWFGAPSRSLWRHCNGPHCYNTIIGKVSVIVNTYQQCPECKSIGRFKKKMDSKRSFNLDKFSWMYMQQVISSKLHGNQADGCIRQTFELTIVGNWNSSLLSREANALIRCIKCPWMKRYQYFIKSYADLNTNLNFVKMQLCV